jgi:hypothetical protein
LSAVASQPLRDGRTEALDAASVTLEEFLASLPDYRSGRLERRVIVHGHCTRRRSSAWNRRARC